MELRFPLSDPATAITNSELFVSDLGVLSHIINRLCAPAAAISNARLAASWPWTSLRSG